jgi:hypothetical protein
MDMKYANWRTDIAVIHSFHLPGANGRIFRKDWYVCLKQNSYLLTFSPFPGHRIGVLTWCGDAEKRRRRTLWCDVQQSPLYSLRCGCGWNLWQILFIFPYCGVRGLGQWMTASYWLHLTWTHNILQWFPHYAPGFIGVPLINSCNCRFQFRTCMTHVPLFSFSLIWWPRKLGKEWKFLSFSLCIFFIFRLLSRS